MSLSWNMASIQTQSTKEIDGWNMVYLINQTVEGNTVAMTADAYEDVEKKACLPEIWEWIHNSSVITALH